MHLSGRGVALSVGGSFLAPLAVGAIATAEQYGRASAWGVEASAAVTFRPLRWLSLQLEGDYQRVALGFNGTGVRVARSSADQVAGGLLSVGFAM